MGLSIVAGSALGDEFQDVAQVAGSGGKPEYVVGTGVEYAAYVELGTSKMEAQPYLFPAARQVTRNFEKYERQAGSVDELVATLALAIEREAKKLCPVDTTNLRSSITATEIS